MARMKRKSVGEATTSNRCQKTTVKQKPDSTTKTRGGRHSMEEITGHSMNKLQQPAKKPQRRSEEPKADTSGTKEPEMAKRKTRKSCENQSESSTNKVPDEKPNTGGHSPRKKRLRSVDKIEQQQLLSKEFEKPSPAKILKGSSNKKIDNSLSMKDSLKRQKAYRGLKETKGITENANTAVNKKAAQKKSPRTTKQLSIKSNKTKTDQGGSAKSTPKSLYDFTADSPKTLDSDSVDDNSEKQTKSIAKSTKVGASKRQKPADRKTRLRNRVDPSLITPKTKRCRVVLSPVDQNRGSTKKKIKVKVDIHIQDEESKKSGDQKNVKDKGKGKKDVPKKLKKVKTKTISHVKDSKDNPIPKMPSISFLDNEITAEPYDDDSAIFMSPKPVMPLQVKKRKEKGTPIISGNIKDKRLRSIDCSFNVENIQSTSTPNPEPKPDSEPIRDKVQEFGEPKLTPPVFSPVKQLDTPATSDYGSMVETPSTDTDYREREHSPSPAFSLEDNTDTLSVNKSMEKSYKRSKKKIHRGRYSVSKVDEWAEKMNSEMQDIENFELSVEG